MAETRRMMFTAMIQREGEGYVSLCPELDIASQGDSVAEAKRNLIEAVEGFMEVAGAEEVARRLGGELLVEPMEVTVG